MGVGVKANVDADVGVVVSVSLSVGVCVVVCIYYPGDMSCEPLDFGEHGDLPARFLRDSLHDSFVNFPRM